MFLWLYNHILGHTTFSWLAQLVFLYWYSLNIAALAWCVIDHGPRRRLQNSLQKDACSV